VRPVIEIVSLFERALSDLAGAVWFWVWNPPWHGLLVLLAGIVFFGILLRKPHS
jgi:hypothetical protein